MKVPPLALLVLCLASVAAAQADPPALPRLHHVGLNSADPERAIEWYLRVWPAARRTVIAGQPAIEADMLLLFNKVDRVPIGAWRHDVHRSDPQSAFWHIGAFVNTTDMAQSLGALGVKHLPLFTAPDETTSVWRSGLAPYSGTVTAATLPNATRAAPRPGGFSYVEAPDGVLFEFTGGPDTRPSLSHVHFFHEQPQCAANWYVQHLGMQLPPVRDSSGHESPRPPYSPCEATPGEAGWPSLERIGTIRLPNANVRHGSGTMSFYPRQCVNARCGKDQPLAPSRGQALDHLAFAVENFDALLVRLRSGGVKFILQPYQFGSARAVMIEDLDGLAIELIDSSGLPTPTRP
jgi:catechol 2,3-dioxygenase-like lactoylglutathione lyase family enzyme